MRSMTSQNESFRALLPESDDPGPRIAAASGEVRGIIERALARDRIDEGDVLRLLTAEGDDLAALIAAADAIRREDVGDDVTYVINRNINFTNVCVKRCEG